MQTVVLYFKTATKPQIEAILDRLYPTQRHPWVALGPLGDPVLYLNTQDPPLLTEDGPEYEHEALHALGEPPVCAVSVDVSGRHRLNGARNAVIELAEALLSEHPGIVSDDEDLCLWTLGEIRSGVRKNGHVFCQRL